MKSLIAGHRYELANHERKDQPGQIIQFIQKERVTIEKGPNGEDLVCDKFVTISDGTTNEEVLEMLIDRLKCLAIKVPSRETSIAITKGEECLMWLNKRTQDRLARGVENTPKA